jgi:nicotinamide/nicotinate riboside kinase
VQDWDAPSGAISWPKLVNFLHHVKETGEIPPDHRSHDHLNEQKLVKVDDEVREELTSVFEDLKREQERKGGQKIIWGLVDGFLLYWNKVRMQKRCLCIAKDDETQEVIDQLDVRIFLRVPHDVLKKRRFERHGYHTLGKKTQVLALCITLMIFFSYAFLIFLPTDI